MVMEMLARAGIEPSTRSPATGRSATASTVPLNFRWENVYFFRIFFIFYPVVKSIVYNFVADVKLKNSCIQVYNGISNKYLYTRNNLSARRPDNETTSFVKPVSYSKDIATEEERW